MSVQYIVSTRLTPDMRREVGFIAEATEKTVGETLRDLIHLGLISRHQFVSTPPVPHLCGTCYQRLPHAGHLTMADMVQISKVDKELGIG